MPFEFKELEINGVYEIIPEKFNDKRGYFAETFKESEFEEHGINFQFKQDNESVSSKGVIRGLHYQLNPQAQGLLVRVVTGKLMYVIVDIRKGAPTYGKYITIELDAEIGNIVWVPPDFAHGVCVLEDNTRMVFKSTNEHSPNHHRGIRFDDPKLGIDWPIDNLIISDKDRKLPFLENAEINFFYES